VNSSEAPLPASFMFGVATADHQCEAYVDGGDDVRDLWERRRGETLRGRATDFWERYREDIGLARDLGCKAFRISLAWTRLEPQPGQFDDAAFAHYRDVLAAIRAAGMCSVVTLHHYTWPVHVERAGGMTDPGFVALFRRYARESARRVGDLVDYWITFNEPTQLVFGYVKPWWMRAYAMPPGLEPGADTEEQVAHAATLMRNLFLSHAAARAEIKALRGEAKVGANPLVLGLPNWLQRFVDWQTTRVRSVRDLARQSKQMTEYRLLQVGTIDVVIAEMTATRERSRDIQFSEAYYIGGQRLVVLAASAYQGPHDFAGKWVAVVATTTSEAALSRVVPAARELQVDDYDAAFAALDSGSAGAILGDETILRGTMLRHSGRYRFAGPRLTEEPYAVAVPLGSRELLNVVDAAVRAFKAPSVWADAWRRSFPDEPVADPPLAWGRKTLADLRGRNASLVPPLGPSRRVPRASVLARIRRRGRIIIGIKDDVPGMALFDAATKTWSGFEIDLARTLAKTIFGDAARVEFRPVSMRGRMAALRSFAAALVPFLQSWSMLSTLSNGNWWHLGMAGKLSSFLCPPEAVGQQDFVGLDYYWGVPNLFDIGRLADAARAHYSRAPVWPATLYSLLRNYERMFPGKEILLIENGCVNAADGVSRVDYIERHVREVQRAVAAGVPVSAYLYWSITTNREWGLPLDEDSDFGLYHIDLDTDEDLKRTPTPAAEAYRRIIAQRGV